VIVIGTADFESLLLANECRVLRTAWRILGSLEDAKDASQEVFLRLHKHLAAIDHRTVHSWLYRTTLNVCFDALRRRRPEGELDFEPESADDPAREVDMNDRKRLLERAIRRLPERERAVLVLREIEGLETAEVAEILGISEVTVRSQVSMAKSRLRGWLEGLA
jgi:RNA polymerase sigma-70 factor (ECF subfamily)